MVDTVVGSTRSFPMLRTFVCAVVALVVVVGVILAGDYKGKVKNYDATKMTVTVTVDDKDQDFTINDDTKIVQGKDSTPVKNREKALSALTGREVTIKT